MYCQGGALSASLFSLNIEEILTEISRLKYDWRIGIIKLNIQAYQDNIVLMTQTAGGFQM